MSIIKEALMRPFKWIVSIILLPFKLLIGLVGKVISLIISMIVFFVILGGVLIFLGYVDPPAIPLILDFV